MNCCLVGHRYSFGDGLFRERGKTFGDTVDANTVDSTSGWYRCLRQLSGGDRCRGSRCLMEATGTSSSGRGWLLKYSFVWVERRKGGRGREEDGYPAGIIAVRSHDEGLYSALGCAAGLPYIQSAFLHGLRILVFFQ